MRAEVQPSERILSLDVLRGLALFGMLIVHFYDHAGEGAGISALAQAGVGLLLSGRAYAMFALLFGAGFALQLARARSRGVPFTATYLRRLAVLALFGAVAHGIFGFNVLLGYAVWGAVLLLVQRWSTRVLVVLALLTSYGSMTYYMGRTVVRRQTMTLDERKAANVAMQADFTAGWALLDEARDQPSLAAAVPYRVRNMAWFYSQAWFVGMGLHLFLWGMVAIRLGYLQRPERHMRALALIAGASLAAWIAGMSLNLLGLEQPWLAMLLGWLMSPSQECLMFFYGAVVLLLLAKSRSVTRRLAWFAWPGRAALTNYFIQIVTIDLLLSRYGLGLGKFAAWAVVPAAVGMFGMQLLASRWWFARYQVGPLEWIWRALTHGRKPVFLRVAPAGRIPAAEAG
jgi:uncharacterized protein